MMGPCRGTYAVYQFPFGESKLLAFNDQMRWDQIRSDEINTMQLSRLPFIIHSSEKEHCLWPSLETQQSCRAYIIVIPLRIPQWVQASTTSMACDGGQRDMPVTEARLGTASNLFLKSGLLHLSPTTCPPTIRRIQGSQLGSFHKGPLFL